jgi:hypothetical protein
MSVLYNPPLYWTAAAAVASRNPATEAGRHSALSWAPTCPKARAHGGIIPNATVARRIVSQPEMLKFGI